MDWIRQIFSGIKGAVQWWFIVMPWEQAIRVRLGRHVTKFGDGVHIRIPFLDRIYIQNTRLRFSLMTPQTLTTADGKTVTCVGSVRYKIDDILVLHQKLHDAEMAVKQQVECEVAKYVVEHSLVKCHPSLVAQHVNSVIGLEEFGLIEAEFFMTEFAVVKTLRLIGGDMDRRWSDHSLTTNNQYHPNNGSD